MSVLQKCPLDVERMVLCSYPKNLSSSVYNSVILSMLRPRAVLVMELILASRCGSALLSVKVFMAQLLSSCCCFRHFHIPDLAGYSPSEGVYVSMHQAVVLSL